MALDFHTDKIIVVAYPPGAGGKTLINALGLSDDAVFQSDLLAIKQVNNEFSSEDKLSYLLTELENFKKSNLPWVDLNLGCNQLFGRNASSFHTLIQDEFLEYYFNHNLKTIVSKGMYFFLVSHNVSDVHEINRLWPNVTYIIFTNSDNVLERRPAYSKNNTQKKLNKIEIKYDALKGTGWPEQMPKNLSELDQTVLDDPLFEEFYYMYKTLEHQQAYKTYNFFNFYKKELSKYNIKKFLKYDASNLLHTPKFTESLIDLASEIGLRPPNRDFIWKYHKSWLTTIQ